MLFLFIAYFKLVWFYKCTLLVRLGKVNHFVLSLKNSILLGSNRNRELLLDSNINIILFKGKIFKFPSTITLDAFDKTSFLIMYSVENGLRSLPFFLASLPGCIWSNHLPSPWWTFFLPSIQNVSKTMTITTNKNNVTVVIFPSSPSTRISLKTSEFT